MTSDSKAGVYLSLYAPPLSVLTQEPRQEILIELVTTMCTEQMTSDENSAGNPVLSTSFLGNAHDTSDGLRVLQTSSTPSFRRCE